MWRIWLFFGVFEISFGAPVDTPQQEILETSELSSLRCLMLTSPLSNCNDWRKTTEVLPRRIQELYLRLKQPFLDVTKNEVLYPAEMANIPYSLLYLIPKTRLNAMSGTTASDILRRYPLDDALALKLVALMTDDARRDEFQRALVGRDADEFEDESTHEQIHTAPLSPAVEEELGAALAKWYPNASAWNFNHFERAMRAGSPLLASLPSSFLYNSALQVVEKFLYHVRSWRDEHDQPRSLLMWSHHPQHVQRFWAYLALNKAGHAAKYAPRHLRQFFFLLPGATPDELAALPRNLRMSQDYALLLQQALNALQARAVFDVLYSDRELNGTQLNEVNDLAHFLTPQQVQQFNVNTTEFGFLAASSAAVPTEKQLLASHIANCVVRGLLPGSSPSTWNQSISHLGRLVHVVPASQLAALNNTSLPGTTLTKLDSYSLSYRQARYLTHGPVQSSPLTFKGLLKSIPASSISGQPSNLMAQNVKQHLLAHVSASNPALSLTVLDKIWNDIDEVPYLESLLYNKDHKELLSYISSRVLAKKFHGISTALHTIVLKSPELEKRVRLLPVHILSQLLALHRHEVLATEGRWTWENLVESPRTPALKYYVRGLTCADIAVVETTDVIPILGYYVRELRGLQQPFPKNMQYCCQKALTEYLDLKASLRGLEPGSLGLGHLLESHEVKAVGGYILSSLPIELIASSHLLHHIVAEVGKLSIPELVTALRPPSLRFLAHTVIQLDLKGLARLGNLIWFLDGDHLNNVGPPHLKLHLESLEETASRAVCLTEQARSNWRRLLVDAFGKPDAWSAGVLQVLGDLLLVLDEYELSRIKSSSWTRAADQLVKYSSLHSMLEWPGKTRAIPFYEACADLLPGSEGPSYVAAVQTLLNYYMKAAQMQLDTVVSAETLLQLQEVDNSVQKVAVVNSTALEKQTTASPTTTISSSTTASTTPTPPMTSSTSPAPSSTEEEALMNDQPHNSLEDEDVDWVYDENEPVTIDPLMVEKERWRREIRKEGKSKEGEKNHKEEEKMIFRSQDDSRTAEERRQELQRNATRDLVVEVVDGTVISSTESGRRTRNMKISCDAIRMLGPAASLVLDQQDLELWTETELEDCSEVLGTLQLPLALRRSVLQRLNLWKESNNLLEVGGLVAAMDVHDVANLTLDISKPWTLENLATLSSHIDHLDILDSIASNMVVDNPSLSELRPAEAAVLGRLVCTLPHSQQRRLLATGSFARMARHLARTIPCNSEYHLCLTQMAILATDEDGYGATSEWTAHDVADLDVIVAGLQHKDWHGEGEKRGLQPEALAGLSPAAVVCIPPNIFKDLSEEQLFWLPALSVAVVSPAQSSGLTPAQSEILDRVRRQVPDFQLRGTKSSGSFIVPFLTTTALPALLLLVRTFLSY